MTQAPAMSGPSRWMFPSMLVTGILLAMHANGASMFFMVVYMRGDPHLAGFVGLLSLFTLVVVVSVIRTPVTFTVIELALVITLIGVLAWIAYPKFASVYEVKLDAAAGRVDAGDRAGASRLLGERAELLQRAARDLAEYQRLTAEGKLGEAGQRLEALKQKLDQLQRAPRK